MAYLLTAGRFQAFDNAGNPVSGGKVFTYAAGTTTPKASYTTQAGNVSNANPVVLDSAGRAAIWLGTGAYRIVVKSADEGTTFYDEDNISAPASADTLLALETDLADTATLSKGDAKIGVKRNATGSVARTQHAVNEERFISVKDFGAVGDGTTDDTAAFSSAITAAIAQDRALYIPGGDYLLNGGTASGDGYKNGLLVPFNAVNADPATALVIFGDGGVSRLLCGSNTMVLVRIARNNVTLRDVCLDANSKTSVILCGVVPEDMTQTSTLVSQSFVDIVNVGRVGGAGADGLVFQPGPHVGGSDSGCFYHNVIGGYSNFVGGGRHVHVKKNADWGTVPIWVTRTNFIGQRLTRGNTGYQFDDGGQIMLIGCNEEAITSGTTPSATPTARVIGSDCDGVQFFGGYSEACSKSVTLSTNNVQSWGYVPASGSNTDWRTYARAWADETDDDLSFTPALSASGGGTQGAGTVTGRSSKQGKTVHVTIQISLAKGTLSGDLSITGLPFVADTNWGSQNMEVTSWSGITLGTNYVKLNALLSGTGIALRRQHGQGASTTALTVADCSDPIVLTIQGTYQAA